MRFVRPAPRAVAARLLESRRAPTPAPAQSPQVQAAWASRARLLAATLEVSPRPTLPGRLGPATLGPVLGSIVEASHREQVWLTLAVMTGVLPADVLVEEVARESEFDNGEALVAAIVDGTSAESARWEVRVADRADVLVDLSATLPLTFTTGIQRVIRETVSRWMERYGARPVAWTVGYTALRDLTGAETAQVVSRRAAGPGETTASVPRTVLVPWRCTYITPEVLAERARSSQVRSLAQYARCRTGAITYDCVPLTSSETLVDWGGDTFSWHLAALRYFDQVAAISEAAATEFRGWRRALGSIGRAGPAIDAVLLPVEIGPSDEQSLAAARERFVVADLPLVLVVGSAEPRKNHLAILHAAELLWRRGTMFSLTFVGGRAWGADAFGSRVRELQAAGRPVDVVTGSGDALLYAAYRLARFTIFPSLNEGFGLPAAESLACGTPVITSNFGSMQEIADGGGAVTVNPRSDAEIAEAMDRLLGDDALVARLRAEAVARPERTWDTYAAQTWALLVGGAPSKA
ncbi:glycosyltransferase family 4 protein [Lapillicoccus sp.]|uniref:glycosyltransferase family 4 protein n=1 Tax=Lapillicoccus sp. TaxID=1909287 RepID=UPI0039833BDF